MPTEAEHHLSGDFEIAVILALAAGSVDAFVYQNVTPVFVANMSGNLIRFGIATGTMTGSALVNVAAALACFVLGAIGATSYVDRQMRRNGSAHARTLLASEAALVAMMALMTAVTHARFSSTPDGWSIVVVVLGASAMGMQAIAIRRVGQTAISTTYGTGALVRLSEKAALGMRGADRPHGIRRRHSIAVIASVLVAYVVGAAVAAALPANAFVLLGPATLNLCAAALTRPPSTTDQAASA